MQVNSDITFKGTLIKSMPVKDTRKFAKIQQLFQKNTKYYDGTLKLENTGKHTTSSPNKLRMTIVIPKTKHSVNEYLSSNSLEERMASESAKTIAKNMSDIFIILQLNSERALKNAKFEKNISELLEKITFLKNKILNTKNQKQKLQAEMKIMDYTEQLINAQNKIRSLNDFVDRTIRSLSKSSKEIKEYFRAV